MQRISVRILPEKELPAYQPGEMIRGRVILRATERIQFSRLQVHLFSQPIQGDGGTSNGQSGTLDGQGELTPLQDATYKFAFQVPESPQHWDNRHLHTWHLRVTAQIPDDFDVDEELRIYVVAKGEEKSILQASDEQLREPGTPGAPAKVHQAARRPEPTPAKVRVNPGELITALLVGLVPLGFMAGGMLLALNGLPDRVVPGGVRVFALLALLGGFFVLRKITEVKGAERFFRIVNGTMALAVGALGCLIAFWHEGFSWTHPSAPEVPNSFLAYPRSWNFWMGFTTAALFMPLAGLLFAGKANQVSKMYALVISAPATWLALWMGAVTWHMAANGQEGLMEPGAVAVLSAALAIGMLIRPEWRNAPFVLVALSMVPLVLTAAFALTLGNGQGWFLGAALLATTAYFLYMGSRNLLAQRHLGKVTVVCDPLPEAILLGSTQTVRVDFIPRSAVVVDHILAQWTCTEHRSYTVGTDRRSDTTVLYTHRDHAARNITVQPGQLHRSELSCIFLPSLKPTSDTNPYHVWKLDVKIVVKGKPDWDTEIPLVVRQG